MVRDEFPKVRALALALLLPLAACETSPTALSESGPSRILLSTAQAATVPAVALSRSVAAAPGKGPGAGRGPIDLTTVERIDVRIVRIALLPGTGDSAATEGALDDRGGWIELDLSYDPTATWFDLKNPGGATELALVPDNLPGEVAALRLTFGAARVTFVDGTEENLFVPSGKITIPASGATVNQGEDIAVVFSSGRSVRRIIRTGNGLLMPPVFHVENGRGGGPERPAGEEEFADEEGDDDEQASPEGA